MSLKNQADLMSYDEIAVKLFTLGYTDHIVTRQRVQQIEKAAMSKLKKLMAASRVVGEWRS